MIMIPALEGGPMAMNTRPDLDNLTRTAPDALNRFERAGDGRGAELSSGRRRIAGTAWRIVSISEQKGGTVLGPSKPFGTKTPRGEHPGGSVIFLSPEHARNEAEEATRDDREIH